MDGMDSDSYAVRVDNIFEGPMDLLIHLIRKNEVDIYDIPIALITEQYLQYLEWMQTLNIDLAGDFVLMAATLAQIKSRLLLPVHGEDPDDEDPRMALVRPLTEYLQIKAAAEALARRNVLGEQTFTRPADSDGADPGTDPEMIRVGLFELIDAFQRVLDRIGPAHQVDMNAEAISIKERIGQIVDLLEVRQSLTFEELFETPAGRAEVIVTFLALLEMARLELIEIAQHVQSGIIRIFYR